MSTAPDVQIDGQAQASWDAIVSSFADASVYQSWAYGAVRWGAGNLSHIVLRHGGSVVAAAQIRIAKLPVLSAGIAYLRWGPLCRPRDGAPDPAVLAEFLQALQREYVHRRGLALQILPNSAADAEWGRALAAEFQRQGFATHPHLRAYRTVLVNLTPPADEIRKNLDKKWRNQLNGADKNGLQFEITRDDFGFETFIRMYKEMLARKQFDTNVSVNEFRSILRVQSPEQRMHVFIARAGADEVAALVCDVMGDTAIYLLGATSIQGRDLKAAYFLHWQAMLWMKQHGITTYDLGGVDEASNPGGHHFKSGFGGADVTYVAPQVAQRGLLNGAISTMASWPRRLGRVAHGLRGRKACR